MRNYEYVTAFWEELYKYSKLHTDMSFRRILAILSLKMALSKITLNTPRKIKIKKVNQRNEIN